MPRSARIAPGGLIYHVLNRAVAKMFILGTDKDRSAFLNVLAEACGKWPDVRLLGWCLMSSHWHLILWPKHDGELKLFMHWLTLTHASRWRTSRRTIGYGPLYQGRYKSFAIEKDEHYLTVLRYVERNPLRAKRVTRAEVWAWSSLWVREGDRSAGRTSSRVPDLSPFLQPGPVELPGDWVEEVNRPQTAIEEEAMLICIRRSRPYGDEAFQKRTAKRLGLASCFRDPGRPALVKKKPAG
jgi:putative transposase